MVLVTENSSFRMFEFAILMLFLEGEEIKTDNSLSLGEERKVKKMSAN